MIHKEVIAYEIYIASIVARDYISRGFYHESDVTAPLAKAVT